MPRPKEQRRSAPRALAGAALGVLLLFAAAACSDDSDDGGAIVDQTSTTATTAAGGGATDGSTVVARDFSLTSISVAPGAEVTFSNEGAATHTLTADDGAFDSGSVAGGSSATLSAPAEPGAYAFHCEIHPSMTGTLTVEG